MDSSSKRNINSKEEMKDISDANGQPLGLVGKLVLLEELDRRDREKSRGTATDGQHQPQPTKPTKPTRPRPVASSKSTDPANWKTANKTTSITKTAEGRHPSLDMSESNNSLIGMTGKRLILTQELADAVASPVDSTRARSSLQVSGTNQITGMTSTAPHQFPGQDNVQQNQQVLIGAVAVRGATREEQDVSSGTNIPDLEQQAVVRDNHHGNRNAGLVVAEDYFKHVGETGDDLDVDLAQFLLETRQRAFDWIVNQDPMQLEYDSPNLVQRFLLVLFYYQTTRHQPWKVCNPAAIPQGSASSGFCYKAHHVSGEITTDIWGDQWLSASHECKWAGVICGTVQSEETTVAELRLALIHLNGPLPWEITRLSLLRGLRLSSNMLTGTLPPRLFSKKAGFALETLGLSSNQISGAIPAEWVANLLEGNGELAYLDLYGNTLTGKIPSELGQLPLKRLILATNTLTGSIPQEIFNQTSLQWLFLGKNDLTGTLPSEAGLLTNLKYLNLNYTQISGTLPSEIGLLNQLEDLILSNTNMQGTIPEELFTGLDNLWFFGLDGCNFTGTISSSVGLFQTTLQHLYLANNNFHGTIPSEIEALTLIRELLVNGNDLSGTVPVSFCQNLFAGEKGSKVVADCLPNAETGIPAIHCPSGCCTSCCDKTGLCLST
ncbi:Leucine Rich Repeat [Seminavis robusta]|uniref:Leucine Rich Repeat n=1 Tax=Seminavis robusta TaxID=568900 RepID=A0A9N8H2D2_9STRA|nr:Leucine Rich Repeat [Seminavis robusta]|eukprot:Sro7_g005850.1 Leucine Rich Repeat (664) ;mRNA; r:58377-60817